MALETTKAEFWENLWKDDYTPWQEEGVNERLIKFLDELTRGRPNLRVFVPLCGKSLDLLWLADKGHTVVGVELAKKAIESFFSDNKLTFTVDSVEMAETTESKEVYKCNEKRITIVCCDLFKLTEEEVGGKFDAIWDRGSLSAIAPSAGDRGKLYTEKLHSLLSPDGRYMLESDRYEVDRQGRPPANIKEEYLNEIYGKRFIIKELDVYRQEPTTEFPVVSDVHYHLFTPK